MLHLYECYWHYKKKDKIVLSKKGKKMRIIGGKARGTKLYTLEGKNTRPTLDRVKESLFNIIQRELPDSIFLDLFSGSGAIGLEAVSRGARKAILCDKSKEAIDVIKKNVMKTHAEKQTEVYQCTSQELLQHKIVEKPNIIYIDPPYETDLVYQSLNIMKQKEMLTEDVVTIIETDQKETILKQIEKLELEVIDLRKYGRAYLIFVKEK